MHLSRYFERGPVSVCLSICLCSLDFINDSMIEALAVFKCLRPSQFRGRFILSELLFTGMFNSKWGNIRGNVYHLTELVRTYENTQLAHNLLS